MMQWDRLTLGRMAKELGFPRDTLEKVCRLAEVLTEKTCFRTGRLLQTESESI